MCLQFLRLLTSPSSLLACTLPTVGSVNSVNSETTGVMNRISNTPSSRGSCPPGNEPESLASPALSHQGRPHTHTLECSQVMCRLWEAELCKRTGREQGLSGIPRFTILSAQGLQ